MTRGDNEEQRCCWTSIQAKHNAFCGLSYDIHQAPPKHPGRKLLFLCRPGKCPLAGNSVHMDVAFLRKHMPTLLAHFNHRLVDVSSISELARRWYPAEYLKAPQKTNSHLAMTDIQESINELKHYSSTIFRKR